MINNRPRSAKPGIKKSQNLDDDSLSDKQFETQQIPTESNNAKTRLHSTTTQYKPIINIVKPIEVSNGEFSRIMPKKMLQDKQRLYSEALQLKQNMHGVMDQNIKLKTKIAVLEKEKQKLSKMIDNDHYNSKIRSSSSNPFSSQDINGLVTGLKKMLRDAKQQIEYLKIENHKIKKTVKYTKISQIQIQNKNVHEQNNRISKILQGLIQKENQEINYQKHIKELEGYLKVKLQQNERLISESNRYNSQIATLQQTLNSTTQKFLEKEKKVTKDLDLTRRRLNDSQRQVDYLKIELGKMREQKLKFSKPTNIKNINNALNNNINNNLTTTNSLQHNLQQIQKQKNALTIQFQNLKLQNISLKSKIKDLQSALKLKKDQSPKQNTIKQEKKNNLIEDNKKPSQKNQQVLKIQEKQIPLVIVPQVKNQKIMSSQNEDSSSIPNQQKQQNSYSEDFDNYQEKKNQSPQKKKVEIVNKQENYKQDFIPEDQQQNQLQVLYQKQKEKEKEVKKKKHHNKKKKKSKSHQIQQLSQLLTYRMRAQRYPFQELKQDIIDSGQSKFKVEELESMLSNSPFLLTEKQIKLLMVYLFDSKDFSKNSQLALEDFINKLRDLIKEIQIIEEKQEEQMYIQIAQMVTSYAAELEAAFQQNKNGQQTISMSEITNLFKKLELSDIYIQLIIGELSLVSEDLEHLNYFEFFKRFYIDEDEMAEGEQEYENERTLNRNMIQQEQFQQSEESRRSKKRSDDKKKKKNSSKKIEKTRQNEV